MWDQYAENHAGACLVFERDELIGQAENAAPLHLSDIRTWGRVQYRDAALSIPLTWEQIEHEGVEAVLDDHTTRRNVATDLYLTKSTDWESEQEFRIVTVIWDVSDSERLRGRESLRLGLARHKREPAPARPELPGGARGHGRRRPHLPGVCEIENRFVLDALATN